jgi:hypothetical protein
METPKEEIPPIEKYTIQKHLKAVREYIETLPKLRRSKLDDIEILCCDVLAAIKARKRNDV